MVVPTCRDGHGRGGPIVIQTRGLVNPAGTGGRMQGLPWEVSGAVLLVREGPPHRQRWGKVTEKSAEVVVVPPLREGRRAESSNARSQS